MFHKYELTLFTMQTIRWGIIGAGDVTEKKSGPAFNKVEGSEITAVMRRSENKARNYAKRHKITKWYTNAENLINDPEVNAVYIATPPYKHAVFTKMALEAGKPVYVEKPMALNTRECQDMINAADKNKVSLFVAYYRRALPNFLAVKSMIDQNKIGQITSVDIKLHKPNPVSKNNEIPWRLNPEISGGGLLYDLGSHQLDLMDYLFGPISKVKGYSSNTLKKYPADDVVQAIFQFENGLTGAGSWNFTVDTAQEFDLIEITGTEGKIRFPCFGPHEVYLHVEDERESMQFDMPENIQLPLIQQVVEALQGKRECSSTGNSAIRTSKILDQITHGKILL